MTLWEILGFGTNQKTLQKEQEIKAKNYQKTTEYMNNLIEILVRNINREGIQYVLKQSRETENEEFKIDFIKAVLKKYKDEPPIKSTDWQKNWPESQQWLYEQEHPEIVQNKKELDYMKDKIEQLEAKIAQYEKNK